MAKMSFVLLFSLVLALPFRSVLGQDNPWQGLIDQASSQGISQDTVKQAQKAMGDAEDDSTPLNDWVKGQKSDIGYTEGNASTESTEDSQGEGGVSDDLAAEAPEDVAEIEVLDYTPAEAPGDSAADGPGAEGEAQAPDTGAPQAEAPTPESQATDAATPRAEAAAPIAQPPGVASSPAH